MKRKIMILLRYVEIYLDIKSENNFFGLLKLINYIGHSNWLLKCQNFLQHYH